jgi:hypothetical protein
MGKTFPESGFELQALVAQVMYVRAQGLEHLLIKWMK